MRRKTQVLAGVCMAALVEGACGGRSGGLSAPSPTPTDTPFQSTTLSSLQAAIFTPSCAISGSCHLGPTSEVMGFDLSSGHTYASTVGVPSNTDPNWDETFNGLPLPIVATNGSTNGSYLFLKIIGAPGITGNPAPEVGSPLTANQIAAVAAWIRNGARDDSPFLTGPDLH